MTYSKVKNFCNQSSLMSNKKFLSPFDKVHCKKCTYMMQYPGISQKNVGKKGGKYTFDTFVNEEEPGRTYYGCSYIPR